MSRHDRLPALPLTKHIQSSTSVTHNVDKLFLPCTFAPQMRSPVPVHHLNSLPSSSFASVVDVFSNSTSSSTPLFFVSSARQCSSPFSTRPFDHERRTYLATRFNEAPSSSTPHSRISSSFSSAGATFVQSPSRLESAIDGAPHNRRHRFYS